VLIVTISSRCKDIRLKASHLVDDRVAVWIHDINKIVSSHRIFALDYP